MVKINVIRNSIVGTQTLNWTEHIYPFVTALDDAGIEGLPYPFAKPSFTLRLTTKRLTAERLKKMADKILEQADEDITKD